MHARQTGGRGAGAPDIAAGPSRHRGPGPRRLDFLDWAAEAGLKIWQVLPLGPTGPDGSPYSSPSAFAGNPLLISPGRAGPDGLVGPASMEPLPSFDADQVDFARGGRMEDATVSASRGLAFGPGGARRAGASWTRSSSGPAQAILARGLGALRRAEGALRRPFLDTVGDGPAHAPAGRPGPRRPGNWPTRSPTSASCSSCSSGSGRRCVREARRARSSAARRHPLLRRAGQRRRLGPPGTVPAGRQGRPTRSRSPGCRRTTSARPGSCGATRSTAGSGIAERSATPGGSSGCGPTCARWTRCAWTTSAASPRTGKSMPPPRTAAGGPLGRRARARAVRRLARGAGRAAAGRRGPGRDHRGRGARCATSWACRACTCCSSPSPTPTANTCPSAISPRSVVYTGTHDNDTLARLVRRARRGERARVLAYLGDGDRKRSSVGDDRGGLPTRPAALALVPLQDLLDLGSEARMNRPGHDPRQLALARRAERPDPGVGGRSARAGRGGRARNARGDQRDPEERSAIRRCLGVHRLVLGGALDTLVGAFGVHPAGLDVVGKQTSRTSVPQVLAPAVAILHREEHLDPVVQVARHDVGAAQVDLAPGPRCANQ